jgi:uncharacterized membrane protein
MSIDLDTIHFVLLICSGISALVSLLVFFVALARGKVSLAWMKRHFH